jgi:hypothetical protein
MSESQHYSTETTPAPAVCGDAVRLQIDPPSTHIGRIKWTPPAYLVPQSCLHTCDLPEYLQPFQLPRATHDHPKHPSLSSVRNYRRLRRGIQNI